MALLRFSSDLDPVSNLLTLQTELERFLRNPAIGLGVSGPGDLPPVNIFDDGDGIVVMAEIPGWIQRASVSRQVRRANRDRCRYQHNFDWAILRWRAGCFEGAGDRQLGYFCNLRRLDGSDVWGQVRFQASYSD